MKTNEREDKILEILAKSTFSSVTSLSEVLYTSPSSIRRDLSHLEHLGLVTRNWGGVVLAGGRNTNAPFMPRIEQNRALKKKCAEAASVILQDGQTVLLDDSTSAHFMLEHIAAHKDMTVFTNNIITATDAMEYGIRTYLIGGIAVENAPVTVGSFAMQMLEGIHTDLCFFSTFAVSDDGEISDCQEAINDVRRKMLSRATLTAYLCDSSKFGTTSLFSLCKTSEVDFIFSDEPGYFEGIRAPRKKILPYLPPYK